MRVLSITAHPDDMEFHAAGTLLKCKERGDDVFVCTINNGNMGHFEIMPPELGRIRAEEARKACELGGFEYIPCDIGDLESYYQSREQKNKVVDVIRYANPDLILTHAPDDYMCDHVAASHLVFDASFMATVPHYETRHPAISTVAPIFYMETAGGVNFNPTEYVDITDVYETKLKMLLCHESQAKWLKEHDNVDYANELRVLAEFRGMQSGCKYAEAFRPCMVNLRMRTKRLLP